MDINILEDGIPYDIDISIDANSETYSVTEISQGCSKGTYLRINLFSNGTEYIVPTGEKYRYFIDGKRPVDNGYILREADEIVGNSLYFRNISHYITDKVGNISLKLGWQNLDTGLINFLAEDIKIKIKENSFYNSNAPDVDEYSLLLDSIGLISNIINNSNTAIKDMKLLSASIDNEEKIRNTNETTRMLAEITRNSQEQTRQKNSTDAVNSCKTATSNCNTAINNANTAINNCATAIANANDATTRANNSAEACENLVAQTTGINDSNINTTQTWSSSKTISEIVGSINKVTLTASSWTGTSAPYTYTLTLTGVTATNLVEITTQDQVSLDQIIAMQNAGIYGYGQSANTLVLKASGDKPTIDLPITVIIKGVR